MEIQDGGRLSNGSWTWGYEDIQHGGHPSFWNEKNKKN